MRRKALALGLATTFSFAACSAEGGNETGPTTPTNGQEQVTEIPVRNILGVKIDMGSDPHMYTPAMKRGEIAAGATAIATCIIADVSQPEQSTVYVRNDEGEEGFISISAGGGKEDEPRPRITPGYDELKALPPCGDSPADA